MQEPENRLLSMIHDFFLIYLPSQRESRPRTVKAYQTATPKPWGSSRWNQLCGSICINVKKRKWKESAAKIATPLFPRTE